MIVFSHRVSASRISGIRPGDLLMNGIVTRILFIAEQGISSGEEDIFFTRPVKRRQSGDASVLCSIGWKCLSEKLILWMVRNYADIRLLVIDLLACGNFGTR